VSSPRPPSARQAPKLNKGSPLPRQRPVVCSRATTTSLAQLARTTQDHRRGRPLPSRRTLPNDRSNHPDEHDRISPHPDSLRFPPVRSSHPCCIARIVKTKKPPRSPLHRLSRPRVTRRLHHPPSGLSDRARVVGPPRAATIAGLPPVSLISQFLDLVTPYALRNLFGVVHHLLDRPAYFRVTSTESDRSFSTPNPPSSTSQAPPPVPSVSARVQSLTVSRTLGYSRSQHCHRGPDPVASHRSCSRPNWTASASLTTALRGFTHLFSGALPSWWSAAFYASQDLRTTLADSAGRSVPAS
jgi:hypothetical protein